MPDDSAPFDDSPPMSSELRSRLLEGCPLVEQYYALMEDSNTAMREGSAIRTANPPNTRPMTDPHKRQAQQDLYDRSFALSNQSNAVRDEATRFSLEAEPELNEAFQRGEAAEAKVLEVDPGARNAPALSPAATQDLIDLMSRGHRAAGKAWDNLERVCTTPTM